MRIRGTFLLVSALGVAGAPALFALFLKSEIERWSKVVKQAGSRVE